MLPIMPRLPQLVLAGNRDWHICQGETPLQNKNPRTGVVISSPNVCAKTRTSIPPVSLPSDGLLSMKSCLHSLIAVLLLCTSGWSQESREYRVYSVDGVDVSEAGRMLLELLGTEASSTHVVPDQERQQLLISGSAAAHQLAVQLLQQMQQQGSVAESLPSEPKLLRSYTTSNPRAAAGMLRMKLGKDAQIAVDEKRNQVHVVAEESLQRQAAVFLAGAPATQPQTNLRVAEPLTDQEASGGRLPMPATSSPAESVREEYRFRVLDSMQAEQALSGLLGPSLQQQGPVIFFVSESRRTLSMTFDHRRSTAEMRGDRNLALQFGKLFRYLDDSARGDIESAVRIVSLTDVEGDFFQRAVRLWKQTESRHAPIHDATQGHEYPDQGRNAGPRSGVRLAAWQEGDAAVPARSGDTEGQMLSRPSADVAVETLPDLDVMILRGRDPDVEELSRIIEEIERLSQLTTPEIDVVYLRNVRGEALNDVMEEVLETLTGPLQGRVTMTPLVKPNALLLIGWGEAVEAAKKLIRRLDETVEPETQLEVFPLRFARATDVSSLITEFFADRGGLSPEVTVTSDVRTNSLVVNAAPRDLDEVRLLITRLDRSTSEAVNEARTIVLKNALAADVANTVNNALQAAAGGTGQQRNAALQMLLSGPDGKQILASGLLDDISLTPDPRTNRIFLTGPPETLPMIEQLIRSLDENPATSAQLKVFQVRNGDASDLVQVLRSLFPEAVGAAVPQLATAENETSLVPVRFSVDVRTNSIIATGTSGDLRIIEVLLLRLDEAGTQERMNRVYRLKNSPALDVANAINNFLRSERVVNLSAPGRQNPFTQIESEVVVVPEPVGNALIISATPRYFEQIIELVDGLDEQPPQVMIQVILAEVTLDNRHEFGVELGLQDSLLFDRSLLGSILPAPGSGYTSLTPGFDFNNRPLGNSGSDAVLAGSGSLGGQALSHFSLGRTSSETEFGGLVLAASSENISLLLRAMNQSRNLEILSRPQVMTLDNQPAFIQVGQKVPRITGTSITQVGQVNSVELENVGLILGVTPRISPEGMVVMEIDAEKSDVGSEIDGIPVSVSSDGAVIRSPRVNIATAQTTVSAASGQTIVIGGLITSDNRSTSRRVPWLGDLPLVGNLFRYDRTSSVRKELLIILTPHVIRGASEEEMMKQMEMSRMSWITSDVFDWLNPDTPIHNDTGEDDVPVIYPDQTPSIRSLEESGILNSDPDLQSAVQPLVPPPTPVPPDLEEESSATSAVDSPGQASAFAPTGESIRPQGPLKRVLRGRAFYGGELQSPVQRKIRPVAAEQVR